MKTPMISFIVVVACIYLALTGFMYATQRSLQYFPQQSVRAGFEEPARFGLDGFAAESIKTADGETLRAWLAMPPKPEAPLILYLHGNAGTLGDRAERFGVFHQEGFGVLVLSWRGYGGSSGSPSETGFVEDGRAAMRFLQQMGVPASRVILFGESLGSGVATQLAANPDTSPLAIVLEAPFTSAADVARTHYWFLPVGLLMKDQYRSIDFAAKVTAPVFVFHGTDDRVVPHALGKRLTEAFAGPKEFLSMDGNGHIDPLTEVSWRAMKDFLKAHGAAPR